MKRAALERIRALFKFAQENEPDSQAYIALAVKIAKKYNVRIPFKRAYCKKCFTLWIPGKTVRVRLDRKHKRIVYTCLKCGHKQSYGYSKEKLKKALP